MCQAISLFVNSGLHFEVKEQEFCGLKKTDYALVFMVRRLLSNWKEVVVYYFIFILFEYSSTISLKLIIIEIISKHYVNIGLNVSVTVFDQDSAYRSALNLFKSFLLNLILINNCRIYLIFDILHLYKNSRKFEDDKLAKFEYIV